MVIKKDNQELAQLRVGNMKQDFDLTSFDMFYDEKVFNLPQECLKETKCPFYSKCNFIPKN